MTYTSLPSNVLNLSGKLNNKPLLSQRKPSPANRYIPKITGAFKIENLQVSACQIQDVGWLPCASWPGKWRMWNLFCIQHTLLGLVFNLEREGLKILCSSREESWLKSMCFSSSTECGERLLQGEMHKMRSFSLKAVGPESLIQLDEKQEKWQS